MCNYNTGRFVEFLCTTVLDTINSLTIALISIATLVFIYGIITYISAGSSGDQQKQKTARSYIIYSVIFFVFILGIWGIAQFLVEGTGADQYNPSRVVEPF